MIRTRDVILPSGTDIQQRIPTTGNVTDIQSINRALQDPRAITRELNNRSLYHFLQYFWPVVTTAPFRPNWHIEYICGELERVARRVAARLPRINDLIINVPPGSTKTITCSIMFPAWCWSQWYWMRFITASYTSVLSLESAEYCRDLIRSSLYQEMYPWIDIKEDKDTKSNYKIVRREKINAGRESRISVGGGRFSTSVGGTLTGFHGDILIVDDPLDPERAASDVELAAANRWFSETLYTRKTDKEVSETILIMQRLHQNDPSGNLLNKKSDNIKHICLPGEARTFRKQINPPELYEHYVDDLLDPVRLSWRTLQDMEAKMGQYGYSGQVGQDPTPAGGGMFKIDHFQIVAQMPTFAEIVKTVRYWDKAGTQGAGAYTVGTKMHLLTNGKWLIEDVKRGRWASKEREDIIRQTAEADGVNVIIWQEQEPGSGGKESAEGTVRNLAGFTVFSEHPTGDKVNRADPFSVQVNNGNVLILKANWNSAFLEEFRFFPLSTYKDQVDSSSGAFNKLVGLKICEVIR